jgi:hypothetical protein
MAVVINLFGGPGCGKSTGAAYVFSKLKMLGVNAELTSEYAKDKTWEGNMKAIACQPYIFGNQVYRIDRCIDDVDVIVTDSPLLLSLFYNRDEAIEPYFTQLVEAKFNEYENLNFFLIRNKVYNPVGRNQTETEATEIDEQVLKFMSAYERELKYDVVTGDNEGYDKIVEKVLDYLRKNTTKYIVL